MKLSEALRKRIVSLAKEQHISLHKLSIEAGIPHSTLNSFINGKCVSPKLVTLLHICEGLRIELADFFNDPIFDDVEED